MLLLTYRRPLLLAHTAQKYDPRLSELRNSDLGMVLTFLKRRFGAASIELKF